MRHSPVSAFEQGTVPISQSGWTTFAQASPIYPALDADQDADVVVIGAGLAGASTALHLAIRGIKVVVLEALQPAAGASGRNAGHMAPYLESLKPMQRWPDGGQRLLDLFIRCRRLVFELCTHYGIDADAAPVGYLDVARQRFWRGHFRTVATRWKDLGYEVDLLSGSDLAELTGTSEYPCGLYWRDGGRVNPFLLTHGMIAAAQRNGAHIFGDSPVTGCEPIRGGWEVRTVRGVIRTKKLVICTNGHSGNGFFPEIGRTNYPCVACGLATKPLSDADLAQINPSRAALIQHPVGLNPLIIDGHGRLITAKIPNARRADKADLHFAQFLDFLHRAFPSTRDIPIELESYWTGRTFNAADNYPKLYSPAPGVFALVNLGAWGNVMAPLLGMNLANALAADSPSELVLPIEPLHAVKYPMALELSVRRLLIPAAKLADRLGLF
jgi:glycine/D-amino acid oxidase-like deaminating enzyme